uniref:Uncharacterized protein n=1 Tax=Aegilops tauschii subsp. strangulata TaxID=200361 RepID=A0A453MZ28_AEGTS
AINDGRGVSFSGSSLSGRTTHRASPAPFRVLPQDAHPRRRSRNKSSRVCFSLPLAFSRQSVLAAICIDFSLKKRRSVLILIRFLFLADARPVSYVSIGTLTMFSKLAGTE